MNHSQRSWIQLRAMHSGPHSAWKVNRSWHSKEGCFDQRPQRRGGYNFVVLVKSLWPVSKFYWTRLKSEGDEILVCLKYLDFIINRDNLQWHWFGSPKEIVQDVQHVQDLFCNRQWPQNLLRVAFKVSISQISASLSQVVTSLTGVKLPKRAKTLIPHFELVSFSQRSNGHLNHKSIIDQHNTLQLLQSVEILHIWKIILLPASIMCIFK